MTVRPCPSVAAATEITDVAEQRGAEDPAGPRLRAGRAARGAARPTQA
uniref:Uncharacterized protein n=1 Tax=Nonomuraea gerenzanensis TaxID=93944 RepID=A0A1M4DWB2_9ACTN|nr:hypothetical protein BN4615_P368 [Nonomuraea gerenzanensis]